MKTSKLPSILQIHPQNIQKALKEKNPVCFSFSLVSFAFAQQTPVAHWPFDEGERCFGKE
jgi:hypothetical protein